MTDSEWDFAANRGPQGGSQRSFDGIRLSISRRHNERPSLHIGICEALRRAEGWQDHDLLVPTGSRNLVKLKLSRTNDKQLGYKLSAHKRHNGNYAHVILHVPLHRLPPDIASLLEAMLSSGPRFTSGEVTSEKDLVFSFKAADSHESDRGIH
jgi:hypothetical protein